MPGILSGYFFAYVVYYRTINLGGQDEKIYEKTEKHRIARAFRIRERLPGSKEGCAAGMMMNLILVQN